MNSAIITLLTQKGTTGELHQPAGQAGVTT